MRMGFRLKVCLMAALSVALLAAGCSRDSDGLSGTEWTLATLNGAAALEDTSATIMLAEDDELFGSGGCNRFTGIWEAGDDDALTLNAGPMTLMACPEPISSQEMGFMTALADTTSYQRDGDDLTLRNEAEDELATMTKLTPAELTGTAWEVTAYNDGQEAIVSVLADTSITAAFNDDDSLNGSAGCNTYNTSFSTDDDTITIQPAATTRVACDQPVMDQEAAYLAALEQAATYELGEATLYLRTADGALLVSYKAAE